MPLQFGTTTVVTSLAAALLFGGTPAFAGAAYLVATGRLGFVLVLGISLITTLLWDTVWYFIGRQMSLEKIRKHRFYQKNKELYDKVLKFHGEREHLVHFFSRFIYGTASAFSVVSGMRRMNFFVYIGISAVSISLWFSFLYVIAKYLHQYLGSQDYAFALTIAVAVLFVIVFAGRYGLKILFLHYIE